MIITKQQLHDVGIQATEVKPNGDVQFIMADDRTYDLFTEMAECRNERATDLVIATYHLTALIQTFIKRV